MSTNDKVIIEELEQEIINAWIDGDVHKILSFFAQDATLYPPGEPEVVGINAVAKWAESLLSVYDIVSVTLSHEEITLMGDWAYTYAPFTWQLNPLPGTGMPSINQGARGVVMWQKIKGDWKRARVIWQTT